MAEGKKPPGWKSSQGPFWHRTGEQKCKQCLHVSPEGSEGEKAHKRTCDEYPKASGVVMDEGEADERRALYGQRQPSPIDAVRAQIAAIEKQGKPEISDVYRQWVKQGTCVNCGAYPTDPHHEDTTIGTLKRGKGQKARDTLCVSLCRSCHDALTGIGGGYLLPRPDGGEHTHAESKAILHDAQEERLRIALERFPQEWRIEILSKGIACVPEGVKRAALLGGDADDRLAEALDASGEEPLGGCTAGPQQSRATR